MRLGESLRRRRGGRGDRGPVWRLKGPDGKTYVEFDPDGMDDRVRLALVVLGLALGGWLIGYVAATRVFYPAPPPPRDLVSVPDVRGLSPTEAAQRLSEAGLAMGAMDSLRHPTVPNDLILGQSPLPGQLALPGTEVVATRSLGPETRAVPDVTGIDGERARIVLETSGFVVRSDTVEADLPRGHVVSTSPPADSSVALPAEIRVTLSRGPPLVRMPRLVGLDEDAARVVADSIGLVVEEVEEVFRFGRDQGIVVDQDPPADTPVEPGTSVRLSVGRRGG
ncbi:MAG TPA: PASTA domain-containing protein [Longimicrobiales bacterium]|nr:PASTA domain-containing protein [Longimicrobiales bacterium]